MKTNSRAAACGIEPLEDRIAPSTLLFGTPTTATYTDGDGDAVTVKFSKGILSAANLTMVLTTVPDGAGDQLQTIDLTVAGLAAPAAGTNITVTAIPGATSGDGQTAIGFINATGLDLGAVTIHGDLGKVVAGDMAMKTAGLKSLTVQSLGAFGTATGAPDLGSDITGPLGALTVHGDVLGAHVFALGGKMGAVTIGGSLVGGTATSSGEIFGSSIGAVKIGGDIQGGSANASGFVFANPGSIASVTIGGSIVGGTNSLAGVVQAVKDVGNIKIGRDIQGGTMGLAGAVIVGGKLTGITIGGSLIGGAGNSSGFLEAGTLGPVKILGDMRGGSEQNSGKISSGNKIPSVTIGGSLIGGGASAAGEIFGSADIGKIYIGGDVQGGSAFRTGSISPTGNLGSVFIGGSLIGGSSSNAGQINSSTGDIGTVVIGHDLQGGPTGSSGIFASGKIVAVTIGGSILGGAGSGANIDSGADFGSLKVAHDITGDGFGSAMVFSGGAFGSVFVGGSLIGGPNNDTGKIQSNGTMSKVTIGQDIRGGTGARSGDITSGGDLGVLKIGGSLLGGSLAAAASSIERSGYIEAMHIGSITLGGSIIAGTDSSAVGALTQNASIRALDDIASLTVAGSIIGQPDTGTGATPAVISAVGQATPGKTTDLAIGKFTVLGRVEFANILAGYDNLLMPTNGGAQIGTVKVGGNWTASNLVAGAKNTASMNVTFGDMNDASIGASAITAKIASITIGGIINGTGIIGEHFGFVAQQIGPVTVAGTVIPLAPGPSSRAIGATGDVSIHEI